MTMMYLAAPYSDPDPERVARRMERVTLIDGILLLKGLVTVSPLAKHYGLAQTQLPSDWEFWKQYSETLLARCDVLGVITMDGWDTSSGVQGEIAFARENNIPIVFFTNWGDIDIKLTLNELPGLIPELLTELNLEFQ